MFFNRLNCNTFVGQAPFSLDVLLKMDTRNPGNRLLFLLKKELYFLLLKNSYMPYLLCFVCTVLDFLF